MIQQNSGYVHKITSSSLVAACLFMFGALCTALTTNAQANEKIAVPKMGDRAPDFTLQDFNGNTLTLSELTKRKSVLLWFTNLCGGCQPQIPELQKLASLYENKGVEVVAVSVLGEDREMVEEVVRKNKVMFRFLYDPKGEVEGRYGSASAPGICPLKNVFIVRQGGTVTFAGRLPGMVLSKLQEELNKITDHKKEKL